MRRVLLVLFIFAGFAAAQEIKRPTTDIDGGPLTAIGCVATTNIASTAMPLGYDAAGQTTFSLLDVSGTNSTSNYATRVFNSWKAASATYTSLTLNVSSSSGGAANPQMGNACVAYSTDAGGTWTSIRCGSAGWSKTVDTLTLSASQDLTRIQVGVCAKGAKAIHMGELGEDVISVYDIWTAGSFPPVDQSGTGSSSGNAHRGTVIVN